MPCYITCESSLTSGAGSLDSDGVAAVGGVAVEEEKNDEEHSDQGENWNKRYNHIGSLRLLLVCTFVQLQYYVCILMWVLYINKHIHRSMVNEISYLIMMQLVGEYLILLTIELNIIGLF